MTRVEIEVVGLREAAEHIEAMGFRTKFARPAMLRIQYVMLEQEAVQWHRQIRWRRLAKSTVKRKARQRLDPRILRAKGTLEKTMVINSPLSRARGQLWEIDETTARFGIKGGKVDIFYGRFHQRGAGVPKRVIVPRPNRESKRRMRGIVAEWVTLGPGGFRL